MDNPGTRPASRVNALSKTTTATTVDIPDTRTVDRRHVLKAALAGSVASVTGAAVAGTATTADTTSAPATAEAPLNFPDWTLQPGEPFTGYGVPSEFEKQTFRAIGGNRDLPGNGVSWTPLEALDGIITPSGLHFERHHNGVPKIDPGQHRLVIHGDVKQPLTFTIEALLRYPRVSRTVFIECGGNSNAGWHSEPIQRSVGNFHGLVSCSEWSGVPLSIVLDEAGVAADASWLVAEGADAASMNISLPLARLKGEAFLALFQNGERIRPENGYPLRLIVPGLEGVVNVKWLTRLQITRQPLMARNETAKYTELLPSGKARMFTLVMDAKSLITSPSPGQTLKAPGTYELSGLAWSGRGRITKVEVTVDGGETWGDAVLQAPVLPKCFTRFRAPWRWDGQACILKSRATDETGYVQPERDVLINERGREGYFHYNAVVAWDIDDDGTVTHVYE